MPRMKAARCSGVIAWAEAMVCSSSGGAAPPGAGLGGAGAAGGRRPGSVAGSLPAARARRSISPRTVGCQGASAGPAASSLTSWSRAFSGWPAWASYWAR